MKAGTIVLHSGGPHVAAKHSFFFTNPTHTLTIYPEKWSLKQGELYSEGAHTNPWDSLVYHLKFSKKMPDTPEWVGYLTYEMGAFSDHMLPYNCPSIPLAQFFRYEDVQIQEASLKDIKNHNTPLSSPSVSYINTIKLIQEEIRRGDVYQVNLSHERQWAFNEDPYVLFQNLIENSPAPFAAYLQSDNFSILSSSPERLIQKKGDLLETRPIKGTAPRGHSHEEDILLSNGLIHSEKEQAELLMITDLSRNDLGKISLPGSVKVDKLLQIETYSNVFHLVSQISSQAKPHLHPVELLRAVFPGGSITGCPKKSAMESIYRHEKRARGIYTGSIGYFTSNGNFDFNIAIRTLLFQDNILSCGLGGAIVADSVPEKEYQETLYKGASILHSIKSI